MKTIVSHSKQERERERERERLNDLLKSAESPIDKLLSSYKHHSVGLRRKAQILRRKAELAKEFGGNEQDIADYWEKAIQLMSDAIEYSKNKSELSTNYYNRACYKKLNNFPIDEIKNDLRKAFDSDASLRHYAKQDKDICNLQIDFDRL